MILDSTIYILIHTHTRTGRWWGCMYTHTHIYVYVYTHTRQLLFLSGPIRRKTCPGGALRGWAGTNT